MQRNIALFPWFRFLQQLVFFQATWFLYFESRLSAAEAILLYVVADVCTTVLEVPSGYMSDRLGRRMTLLAAAICNLAAVLLMIFGVGFAQFAIANLLLGASVAFASGTDSALLFESLKADGRAAQVEAAALKAWRFGFAALALSALTGGMLAQFDATLPYVATACAAAGLLVLTALMHEPPHGPRAGHRATLGAIRASLVQPTLVWIMGLTLVMYVFSHIPFVFGQPFIREALASGGYGMQAPLISGGVTFAMMVISLAVSLVALPLRGRLGLAGILLLAVGMQVALTAALALSNNLLVIMLLLFRMVPDSLSQPFVVARMQPLLPDNIRATYLSLQSLAGRLVFAATLSLAAAQTTDQAAMRYADMQVVLSVYALAGLVALIVLIATARRAKV